MTTVARDRLAPEPATPFAAQHPWDRNFFLALVALIWVGNLGGFGWDIVHHFQSHERPYLPIVHVHALAFVGWIVLLTTQVLFVRSKRIAQHRRLGVFGAWLAAVMVPLGLVTAWVRSRSTLGTPAADPSFISIQITIMLLFGLMVAAAILLRNRSSAHKRLMLLATIYLSAAGWGRLYPYMFPQLMAPHFGPLFAALWTGSDLMIVAMGAYDLVTRGRLHPAYILGTLAIVANEVLAIWLYVSPWWRPVALRILGH